MNRMNIAYTLAAGIATFGVVALAGGRTADSVTAASQSLATTHTLTLEGANQILTAALAKATERGAGGAIAVVDGGGSLIAFQRIDGTFAAAAAVSLGKARTSAIFKKPTRAFEESINGGRTALAAVHEMTPLQGGIPIFVDGHLVGAIGVSGAHTQQEDEEIALAGAAAMSSSGDAAAK